MSSRTRIFTALAPVLLLGWARPAEAQLSVGLHVARAQDVFEGANGLGVGAEAGVPLFPVSVRAAADYFFPDCGSAEGCSFLGGSLNVNVALPIAVLRPYVTGGLVYRRFEADDASDPESDTGLGAGVGLDLDPVLFKLYVEARYEWVDPDDQWVLRLGFFL